MAADAVNVGRIRTRVAIGLAALSGVLLAASVVAVWSRNQILNTDSYVKTVAPMIEDSVIQREIVDNITEAVMSIADIEQRLNGVLPDSLAVLSETVDESFSVVVRERATDMVRSDEMAVLWREVNRAAHEAVKAVLLDKQSAQADVAGVVDLTGYVGSLVDSLIADGAVFLGDVSDTRLALDVELFDVQGLKKVQTGVRILDGLATLLPVLARLFAALAIVLGRPVRRSVQYVGNAWIGAGVLVLLLMAVVEGMYNTVVQDDETLLRKNAFAIATRGLHQYGRLVLLSAAVVLVLSTLVKHRARGLEFVPSSTEPMRFMFGSVALLWLIIDGNAGLVTMMWLGITVGVGEWLVFRKRRKA
jgi:hypothetical protein